MSFMVKVQQRSVGSTVSATFPSSSTVWLVTGGPSGASSARTWSSMGSMYPCSPLRMEMIWPLGEGRAAPGWTLATSHRIDA